MGPGQGSLSCQALITTQSLCSSLQIGDCGVSSDGVKLLFALSPFERLGICRLLEDFF